MGFFTFFKNKLPKIKFKKKKESKIQKIFNSFWGKTAINVIIFLVITAILSFIFNFTIFGFTSLEIIIGALIIIAIFALFSGILTSILMGILAFIGLFFEIFNF